MPDWAQRERLRDMEWIKENLHVLVPAAKMSFAEQGRGAIVVDTTSQPVKGLGNPFAYFPQAVIDQGDWGEDTKRIVAEYNPAQELVVILMKDNPRRSSTYRFQAFQTEWRRRRGGGQT